MLYLELSITTISTEANNYLTQVLNFIPGIHVDRFADSSNMKTKIFNSRVFSPGTQGVDAFTQIWSGYKNWAVPPLLLVPRTLDMIFTQKAGTLLVCPKWESGAFWPSVVESMYPKADVLIKHQIAENVFVHGKLLNSLIGSKSYSRKSIAILFVFKK